jgi:hypothetical protein
VKRFWKKFKIFKKSKKKQKNLSWIFLASKLNFEKKLSIPLLIKTLATIVKKISQKSRFSERL